MIVGLENVSTINIKTNKMKNIYTIFALLIGGFTFGQECNEPAEADFGTDVPAGQAAISLYSEPFKQKNYKEAKAFWWNAQNKAPKYKPLLYSHGIYIYKDAIKKAEMLAKQMLHSPQVQQDVYFKKD